MVDIHSDEYILGQNIRKYRTERLVAKRISVTLWIWTVPTFLNRKRRKRCDELCNAKEICSSVRRDNGCLNGRKRDIFDEIISIQEKYKMLNPLHKAMVEETIDAYLVKENRVSI